MFVVHLQDGLVGSKAPVVGAMQIKFFRITQAQAVPDKLDKPGHRLLSRPSDLPFWETGKGDVIPVPFINDRHFEGDLGPELCRHRLPLTEAVLLLEAPVLLLLDLEVASIIRTDKF